MAKIRNRQDSEFITILKSFTQETTLKSLSAPLAVSLFMQFDKKDIKTGKGDGIFDSNEWIDFKTFRDNILISEEDMKNAHISKSAIKYFSKQLKFFEKRINKLSNKFQELRKNDYFEEYVNFEGKHNIQFCNYTSDTKLNSGDKILSLDAKLFDRGYQCEEEGVWKPINSAYIKDFDKLSPEVQKEFMEKYNKAINYQKTFQSLAKEMEKEYENLKRARVLLRASEEGEMTNNFRSEEVQNQVFSAWQMQNPYEQLIKEKEGELLKERLKIKPDDKKLSELQNIVEGYYQLSEQWSLRYGNKAQIPTEKPVLNVAGSKTAMHSDDSTGEECFAGSQSVQFSYGNSKASTCLNYEHIDYYRINNTEEKSSPGIHYSQSHNVGLMSSCNPSKYFSVGQNSTLNFDENMTMQNHGLTLRYYDTSVSVQENIRRLTGQQYNSEEAGEFKQKDTTYSTTISASQNFGKLNTGISAMIAEEGTTYTTNVSYPFDIKHESSKGKSKISANITPSISASINPQSNIKTMDTGITGYLQYSNGKGLNANLSVTENFGTQFPEINNNLTVTSSVNYKNLGIAVSNTNTSYTGMNTNNFTTELTWQRENGSISTSYSRRRNAMEFVDGMGLPTTFVSNGNQFAVTARFNLGGRKQRTNSKMAEYANVYPTSYNPIPSNNIEQQKINNETSNDMNIEPQDFDEIRNLLISIDKKYPEVTDSLTNEIFNKLQTLDKTTPEYKEKINEIIEFLKNYTYKS